MFVKSPVEKEVIPSMLFVASVQEEFTYHPRKRMNNELFSGAPTGTLKQISQTGYINSELFLEWLNHFVAHVKPSSNDPVLLIGTIMHHTALLQQYCSAETTISHF
jgi:hypothetical protein